MTKTSLPLVRESNEPPRYWRSLSELNDSQVREVIEQEFPEQAGFLTDEVSRRKFLTLMGASIALAGVGGCGRSMPEKIVPRVRQPEQMVPGKPLYFATAMPMPGGATGLIIESHEGRPTKIEGNPDHPASLGATGVFEQASILGLYDPDRAKAIKHNGQIVGWDDALLELRKELKPVFDKEGFGLAILTSAQTSPTLLAQLLQLKELLPRARLFLHEPTNSHNGREASRISFNEAIEFIYHFDKADVVLSLDSDFLSSGPMCLRHARQFAQRRSPDGLMNRLYAMESMPTPTGFAADHRLALPPDLLVKHIFSLATSLGVSLNQRVNVASEFLEAVVKDLQAAAGRSIVIAGPQQPITVHLLTNAINAKLGNIGKTIVPLQANDESPKPTQFQDLCIEMDAGHVQAILMLGCNPVYDTPGDLGFGEKLKKVPLRVGLSHYEDETAELCHWHIPQTHFLEEWSDAESADGSISIIQPLVAPLYNGKSAHELVAALVNFVSDNATTSGATRGREIVREHWRQLFAKQEMTVPFDRYWRESVHNGVLSGVAGKPVPVQLSADWDKSLQVPGNIENANHYELNLRPDPTIFDGRFANNAWLQELSKPLTKLTWENAAIVSPATATELGITPREGPHGGSHGELITELVELTYRGRTVTAPLYVLPGHADKCVTLHFGYGRTKAGRVGTGLGVNAYALQTSDAPWGGPGLQIKRTGKPYTLACTQSQHSMEGRDLVRMATLAEFATDPSLAPKGHHHPVNGRNPAVEGLPHPPEFYTNPQVGGPNQWGMSVDLGKCIGCNSCVVACQAENNIPVVGKDQVTRGREMHWMRIDRYFIGDSAKPLAVHQPVMCQHCENAPCEVVCPVAATTHSPDGLNEMTYNRCVGTRYCANNCPYKVRRFNFLEYTDYATESLKLQKNPDVSVRVRGVMEKCTYCVQRIREAEITAKVEKRSIGDGDIVTACQQACPTEAIIFGNVYDSKSRVSQQKKLARDYGILTELNTKPRTTYLAAVRNPNPELDSRRVEDASSTRR